MSFTRIVLCPLIAATCFGGAFGETLSPTDDALVLTAPAGFRTQQNFGAGTSIEAFAGTGPGSDIVINSIDFSFLRFDLSSISGNVTSAKLTQRVTLNNNAGGHPDLLALFHVANDNWSEGTLNGQTNGSLDPTTGITGANFGQPFLNGLNKATDRMATANPGAVGTDLVFDFSDYDISSDISDGFLTVVVAFDDVPQFTGGPFGFADIKHVAFSSKEGSNPPFLEIETVVPEPASIAIWSLLGLALAGFGYYRVRRKK